MNSSQSKEFINLISAANNPNMTESKKTELANALLSLFNTTDPPSVQSDWAQSDAGKIDYIKNKPVLPMEFLALISENSPIASQTSGDVAVGSIWSMTAYSDSIEVFMTGDFTSTFTVGTHVTSNNGATAIIAASNTAIFPTRTLLSINTLVGDWANSTTIEPTGVHSSNKPIIQKVIDDFSNWELISGTHNATGAVYRATSSEPNVWANGSDLAYDGSPYIVSTDSDGDINPLINTFSQPVSLSISATGDFRLTSVGMFPDPSKVELELNINGQGDFDYSIEVNTVDDIAISMTDGGSSANDILNFSRLKITVHP